MFKVGEKVKITSNNISGIISKIQKNNYATKYYINVKGKKHKIIQDQGISICSFGRKYFSQSS